MKIRLSVLLLLIIVVILSTPYTNADKYPIVFVGYGKYELFPFLNDAVFEIRTGESLYILVLDGETEVTLTTPDGTVDRVIEVKNEPTVVKRFTERDEKGDWILEVNNMRMVIRHIEPSSEILVELITRLEGNKSVTAEIRGLGRSFAFFTTPTAKTPLLQPGKELRIELNEPIFYTYVVELIDKNRVVDMRGEIKSVGYSLSSDGIIGRWVLHPVKIRDKWFLKLTIPRLNEVGNGGAVPLGYGEKLLRIFKVIDSKPNKILEFETLVAPPGIDVKYFAKRIFINISSINTTTAEAIIVAENGEYKRIKIKFPVARIKLLSTEGYLTEDITITMPNSIFKKINDQFLVVYLQRQIINGSMVPEILEPTREDRPVISSKGVPIKEYYPKPVTFKPGRDITLHVKTYNLTIILLNPNGERFTKEAKISVDSNEITVRNGVVILILDAGKHVIYSLSPPSLEKIEISLENNTTVTLTVVDNAAHVVGLIILLISQILMFRTIIGRRSLSRRSN